MDLTIDSPAFTPGRAIPARFTCDGENISPPLDWSGIPSQAQSLVLIMDDPDAPRGPFSHWVLYNIPADETGLPEDFRPGQDWTGMLGRNSYGNAGYEGPCPPFGETHNYYFRLYAIDRRLDLPTGANRAQVLDHLQDHILAQTELIGTYSRGQPRA